MPSTLRGIETPNMESILHKPPKEGIGRPSTLRGIETLLQNLHSTCSYSGIGRPSTLRGIETSFCKIQNKNDEWVSEGLPPFGVLKRDNQSQLEEACQFQYRKAFHPSGY